MLAAICHIDTLLKMKEIVGKEDLKYSLELSGEWLYDGIKSMPVRIFKINFDFYYELDKSFVDESDEPKLNKEGFQYVITWEDNDQFSFISDPSEGELTLNDAISAAELIVQQKIKWIDNSK